MGRGRPKGSKKDKFDSLSNEFKDAANSLSTDELRKKISDVACLNCEMRAQLKNDGDVESAKEALGNLMAPYREDFKAFKLQIEFLKRVLDDKGGGNTVSKGNGGSGVEVVAKRVFSGPNAVNELLTAVKQDFANDND